MADQITQIFNHFDKDGSGYLDMGEFNAFLDKAANSGALSLDDDKRKAIYDAVDSSGKKDGKITLDELKKIIQIA